MDGCEGLFVGVAGLVGDEAGFAVAGDAGAVKAARSSRVSTLAAFP